MNTPSRADVLLHCGEMTKNELNAAMSALMWRQEFIKSQQSTIDAQRDEIERLTKELKRFEGKVAIEPEVYELLVDDIEACDKLLTANEVSK